MRAAYRGSYWEFAMRVSPMEMLARESAWLDAMAARQIAEYEAECLSSDERPLSQAQAWDWRDESSIPNCPCDWEE